jgi:hypothetical protein
LEGLQLTCREQDNNGIQQTLGRILWVTSSSPGEEWTAATQGSMTSTTQQPSRGTGRNTGKVSMSVNDKGKSCVGPNLLMWCGISCKQPPSKQLPSLQLLHTTGMLSTVGCCAGGNRRLWPTNVWIGL